MKIFYVCKTLRFDICNGKKVVNNYMLEIDTKNNKTRCEICQKITIKTPKPFFYC